MNCTTTVTKVGVIKYHEIYANSILDRANLSRLRPGYLKVPIKLDAQIDYLTKSVYCMYEIIKCILSIL